MLRQGMTTELCKSNRGRPRFLGNEAENQQHVVAFDTPSRGQIRQIYKRLFSEIDIFWPLNCMANATKH